MESIVAISIVAIIVIFFRTSLKTVNTVVNEVINDSATTVLAASSSLKEHSANMANKAIIETSTESMAVLKELMNDPEFKTASSIFNEINNRK